MASIRPKIRITGLQKRKLEALHRQAKALGMTPDVYARYLIEEGLSLEQRARTTSFDELLAPARRRLRSQGRSDDGLDELVDAARTRHHQRAAAEKR